MLNLTKGNCPFCNLDIPIDKSRVKQIFDWHLLGHSDPRPEDFYNNLALTLKQDLENNLERLKHWALRDGIPLDKIHF